MAITEMSLPVDIPWKRIGVSEDMIDTEGGDLRFPEKWRSSVSVFYHEPPELPPEYCKRKITYLKIVCTITSYQNNDITALDPLREHEDLTQSIEWFENNLIRARPCYGALLQVGVYPNPADDVALHDFPYISSFQPRKREMYEALSESGEVTSQSSNRVNVTKGFTGTETTEDYDLHMGGAGGNGSILFGLIGGGGQEENKQVGTVDRNQRQIQDVNTSDVSREKRESHAFSTNINQLYSLLQGYHLGTNRAMFFMQPRPHIQDTKFTFVQGLRRLEGIQEFLLIVNRPVEIPGLCIEVALETAHAFSERAYKPRMIPIGKLYEAGNLNKTAQALGIRINTPERINTFALVQNWNARSLWQRSLAEKFWKFEIGWSDLVPAIAQGHFTEDDFAKLVQVKQQLGEALGYEDVALIFEEYEEDKGQFFVVGRRIHSCFTSVVAEEGEEIGVDFENSAEGHISVIEEGPSVVFESKFPGGMGTVSETSSTPTEALNSNGMIQNLNEMFWSSLGSPERLPYGKVSFLETDLMLGKLTQLLRLLKNSGIEDVSLAKIDGLDEAIKQILRDDYQITNVLDLTKLSTNMLVRVLEKQNRDSKKKKGEPKEEDIKIEARKLHHQILFAALEVLDPTTVQRTLENPIHERFSFEFPEEKLRELERSAGVIIDDPKELKKK